MTDTAHLFVVHGDTELGPTPPVAVCTSDIAADEARDEKIEDLVEVANEGDMTFAPEALKDQFGDMLTATRYEVEKSKLRDANLVSVVYADSSFAGVDEPYGVFFDEDAAREVRDEVIEDLIQDLDEKVATPGKTLRETAENQIHVEKFEIRRGVED